MNLPGGTSLNSCVWGAKSCTRGINRHCKAAIHTTMKASIRLLQHVPLIKFVGGPHPLSHSTVTVHPCAPSGLRPSTGKVAAASSGHASAFQSRNSLSKRFRYPKLDEIEIDDILTGGADVLIK